MDDTQASPLPLPAGYSQLADLASIPDRSVEFAGTQYHLSEFAPDLEPGEPYGVEGDVVSKRNFFVHTGLKPTAKDLGKRTPFLHWVFDGTVSRHEVHTRLLPLTHTPVAE